jgi:anti-sigma factor RsiW
MTCEEALALVAALVDVELAPVDRHAVERHLDTCRSCYSRAEFERHLKQQLAGIGRRDVDGTFEERIRGLIGRFGAGDSVPDAHD